MLFNSFEFSIFLPIVLSLYWATKTLQQRNIILLVASYFFYGLWDWRFLGLILLSTIIDFYLGKKLYTEANVKRRKILLWISMTANLGFLCYFKYFNFFIENFENTFLLFGEKLDLNTLTIILPVGISFYTFQTMSYSIDIYRNKLKPTTNFIAFATFVSFFPQLVAGPIERASNLLPQFYTKHKFSYQQSVNGLRQTLWGLFKKMVIADNCAQYANLMFDNTNDYSGSSLVLGVLFFSFQIYGDFSGYSDIAIGCSRLFGFNLMKNFSFPYFSRDISEFWRRWHISLSTWFRDYLYIPLGGSRGNTYSKVKNTFIIFIVSGLWHGANWTFIFWGFLNALFFMPLLLTKRNRNHLEIVAKNNILPNVTEFAKIIYTYSIVCFTWIFFRAKDLNHAFNYITNIFKKSIIEIPEKLPYTTLFFLLGFIMVEWIGRRDEFAIEKFPLKWNPKVRLAFYYTLILFILWCGGQKQEFIYFQF